MKNGTNPDCHFGYLAQGSFKEVYDCGLQNWVIKFYTGDNPTAAEQYLPNAAKECGLDMLFLPTYWCELPMTIESTYLTGELYEDEGEVEEVPLYLVGWCLQEKVVAMEDTEYSDPSYDRMIASFGIDVVDQFDELGIGNDLHDWLVTILYHKTHYNVFEMFLWFVEKYGVADLDPRNVGFRKNGTPVIFDWFTDPSLA